MNKFFMIFSFRWVFMILCRKYFKRRRENSIDGWPLYLPKSRGCEGAEGSYLSSLVCKGAREQRAYGFPRECAFTCDKKKTFRVRVQEDNSKHFNIIFIPGAPVSEICYHCHKTNNVYIIIAIQWICSICKDLWSGIQGLVWWLLFVETTSCPQLLLRLAS